MLIFLRLFFNVLFTKVLTWKHFWIILLMHLYTQWHTPLPTHMSVHSCMCMQPCAHTKPQTWCSWITNMLRCMNWKFMSCYYYIQEQCYPIFKKKDKIDTILRLAGSALRDIPILQQHFRWSQQWAGVPHGPRHFPKSAKSWISLLST